MVRSARFRPVRTVRLALVAALVTTAAVALAGCGASAGHSGSQTYNLRVTDEVAVGSPLDNTLKAWKKEVEAHSHGRIKVSYYPAGQLMTDANSVDALSQGTIDMNVSTSAAMSKFDAALQLFDLPYAFPNNDALNHLWSSQVGQILNKQLKSHNVEGIATLPLTGHIVLATKRPVKSMSDLHGTKIRVYGGDAQIKTLSALGADGVTVPPTEVASAIQTGVVNGVATGMTYWYENFAQQLPYAVSPGMWTSPYVVWANSKTWDTMPTDLRHIVTESFADSQAVGQKTVAATEKKAEASGHVTVLSGAEKKQWEQATSGVAGQFTNLFGQDLLTAIDHLKAQASR